MLPACLLCSVASAEPDPPLPAPVATPAAKVEAPCETLPGLMSAFQGVTTLRAAFDEVKEIDLLDEPLVSKGHLYYQRPDRLHLATEWPTHQAVTLVGTSVRIVQKDLGRAESVDLSGSEMAKAVVSSLMQVLGGRVEALLPRYRCTASQDADGWMLSLLPLDRAMAKVVQRLRVRVGRDGTLREVRIEEENGDVSTQTFTDRVTNVPFTAAEEKTYFAP